MKTALETSATDIESLVAEVADRFTDDVKHGRSPNIEEYAQQHPKIAHIIRKVFPALAMLDDVCATGLPEPNEDGPTGGVLGDFRLVREIGRGGMGVVYEAEQISLGRRVALKVLPFAAILDKQQLKRFKNEARAAATLSHPNIVAVHSVGEVRSVYFFAMQLVEGRNFAQVIAELQKTHGVKAGETDVTGGATINFTAKDATSDTSDNAAVLVAAETRRDMQAAASTIPAFDSREYLRTVAQLGIQAAEALDHAHQNGVLHRDIKPANLLVDDSGKLWVTDFGLARLESDAGMTMTGDILGTLRYMSPEQALAQRVIIDHRSDIYSLGITLYELLTLRPAYPGDDRQELLRQIAFEEPRPPRRINARIPQDLETIVLKAIEKEPGHRYATAQELADDLRRFVAHEPIRARPATLLHRLTKWSRRHSAVVAAVLTTLFIALAVTTFVVMWANQSERYQRKLAEASQQRAQRSLTLAREAVDEMLTKVATTWMPDNSAASQVQRQFLDRALAIYQQLANDLPGGNRRGADAAMAHERMADIHRHFGEYQKEVDALQTAVEVFEGLEVNQNLSATESERLVGCYQKLAHTFVLHSQLDKASKIVNRGLQLAAKLRTERDPSPQLERDYAYLLCRRAELLMKNDNLIEAMAAIDEPWSRFAKQVEKTQVEKTKALLLEDLLTSAELTNVRLKILLRQRRFDEVVKAARAATALRFFHLPNYADSVPLAERNANLLELQAEAYLAQNQRDDSVATLQRALVLRKTPLGGRTPGQITMAIFLGSEPWLNADPRGVAYYCDTQVRLAAALDLVARPYEAQRNLGEALEAAQILNATVPNILDFWVLHANVAAAVGEHLAARGSPEAIHYFQVAAALWNEIRPDHPQIERLQTGLHGEMPDWEWFRSTHPEYASLAGTRESLKLDNFETAFYQHTLGLDYWQFERWQAAAGHFAASAELRSADQAYDWLHLAMAYHHLGQPDKAKSEYDRAVAQMKQAAAPDPELETIRRATARLLAVGDSLNSK